MLSFHSQQQLGYFLNTDEETILWDLHIYVMSSEKLSFLNSHFIDV